jgi:hypothetical protein
MGRYNLEFKSESSNNLILICFIYLVFNIQFNSIFISLKKYPGIYIC